MDPYRVIGVWLMVEARLSFKYWHSSKSLREDMHKPFFDRTQCEWILKQYSEDKDNRVA